LIVEEAHNYCPERGFGNSVSSSMLRTVASEGRKFGMGLCVVSQRPAKIDKNIISQCNTNIILKVTNPNDLKAIIQSVEGLTTNTADEIQRLPIGVALISGASMQVPIMVDIRTRETSHGGKSVTVFKGESDSNYVPKIPKMPTPAPQQQQKASGSNQPQKNNNNFTDQAGHVHRMAKRLGWVSTTKPDDTISFLAKEAEKMKENVYRYLESLDKLGENFCHENNPECVRCAMNQGCKYRFSHAQKKGLFKK